MSTPSSVSTIEVVVNGQEISVPYGATVADLIEQLNLDPGPMAVELNLEIVPKAIHGAKHLAANDQVEIVSLVGGG